MSVVPISVCPSHGSTKIVRPSPAGTIAPALIGSDAPSTTQVRPARRADDRHLGLVVQLGGPQPVGPDAGRVDDVGGADLELVAALDVAQARADRAPAVLEQLDRLEPVRDDRAEALGLGQHGQHEPGVVGLAVVEEVAAGRRAVGERGQQLGSPPAPEITRWRAGLQSGSSRTRRRPSGERRSRSTAITS